MRPKLICRRGFSLIEISVALSIIGILSSLALFSFVRSLHRQNAVVFMNIISNAVHRAAAHRSEYELIRIAVAGTSADTFRIDYYGYTGSFGSSTATLFDTDREFPNPAYLLKGTLSMAPLTDGVPGDMVRCENTEYHYVLDIRQYPQTTFDGYNSDLLFALPGIGSSCPVVTLPSAYNGVRWTYINDDGDIYSMDIDGQTGAITSHGF